MIAIEQRHLSRYRTLTHVFHTYNVRAAPLGA